MRIARHSILACACIVELAGGCARQEPAASAPPAPASPAGPASPAAPASPTAPSPVASARTPDELVDNLAMLALGAPLDPARRTAVVEALRTNTKTSDQLIDELVRDPQFAHVLVPRVLFGETNVGPMSYPTPFDLQTQKVDGQTVYFYRKPCTLADSTLVTPWWDQATQVRICNADYKPDAFRAKSGYYCSGSMAENEPECGCGPQLINCDRDGAALFESLYQEKTQTIAYIVEHDQPFKDVFTTPYTFRDRNAEAMRIRETLYAGLRKDVPDLSSWPTTGKWAPREELWPGSSSGILTTPAYLYISDGPRDRMRLVFARTWCTTPGSFGVTSAMFKKLVADHANIRSEGEGWKALAAAPGCTDCHARMDYGMQFLSAYPANGIAETPVISRSQHATTGALYMRDIEDPRGEQPLTPQSLGQMIVSQPEFAQCMVTRVMDHVLGPLATSEDRALLTAAFSVNGQMRPLFSAALRLFVQRLGATPPAVAATAPIAGTPALDEVVVPERLASMLHDHCGDCHEDGARAFFGALATKHTLPRALLLDAANLVSAKLMPKDGELREADKVELLESIVDTLAPDPTWAENARAYWIGGLTGSRTHDMAAVKARIASETGYKLDAADQQRSVEDFLEGDLLTLTPSYMTQVGHVALKACRPLVKDQVRYRDCLRTQTRPESFLLR